MAPFGTGTEDQAIADAIWNRTLTDDDQIDVDAFEALACADLFVQDEQQMDPWPWRRLRGDAWHRRMASKLAAALETDGSVEGVMDAESSASVETNVGFG